MTRSFMNYPAGPAWLDPNAYRDMGTFLDYKMRSATPYSHFADAGSCGPRLIWGGSFSLERAFALFPRDPKADIVLFVRGDPRSPTAPLQKFEDPAWYWRMIPTWEEVLELLGPDVRFGPRNVIGEEPRVRNSCGGGLIF